MKIIADILNEDNNSAAEQSGQERHLPFSASEQNSDELERIRQEIFKSYEGVMAICKQADVPTNIRNIISGLIKISGGKVIVRANDFEIASVFYQDESQRNALKKKVQRWRMVLDKWQTKTGFTLVRFRSGYQTMKPNAKGELKPQNEKTEYHLIVLDLAAKVIAKNGIDADWIAKTLLGELKALGLPSKLDESRKNPLTVDRCFNTSTSWIKKTLKLALQDGELKAVIRDMQTELQSLINEFLEENENEGGTHASYLELNGETLLDTRSTILSSYFFNKDVLNNDDLNDEVECCNSINTSDVSTLDLIEVENSPNAELQSKLRIESEENSNLPMLEIALSHARRGFRVFPVYKIVNGVCSCRDGADCPTTAKHPRISGWNTEATIDETTIRSWWRRFRNANIGIATGDYTDESILVVLDLDTKADGFESLKILEKEFGRLPETLTAITGSGGRHFFFLAQRGLNIRNLQASQKLGKGLDIRGLNGFVVAAGSIHKSSNRYEWIDENIPIVEMPNWMVKKLTAPIMVKRQRVSTSGNGNNRIDIFSNFNNATVIHEHEGRNSFLFLKALHFFRNGSDRQSVERQIVSLNNTVCVPPVGRVEIEKLITSAEERYQIKL